MDEPSVAPTSSRIATTQERRRSVLDGLKAAAAGFAGLSCCMLSGCDTTSDELAFPSPDGNVQLIQSTEMGGGAAGYVAFDVSFNGLGDDGKRPIGGSEYPSDGRVFWKDNVTVNVCGFRAVPEITNRFRIVGYDHIEREYHVTSYCPGENGEVSSQDVSSNASNAAGGQSK